jgi:hypothetical protein
MGVSGLWPDLFLSVAYRPANIVQWIHDNNWTLGIDVPVAVRSRWHSKYNGDCVQSILDQHDALTQASEQNPWPIKQIKYVFDTRVRELFTSNLRRI